VGALDLEQQRREMGRPFEHLTRPAVERPARIEDDLDAGSLRCRDCRNLEGHHVRWRRAREGAVADGNRARSDDRSQFLLELLADTAEISRRTQAAGDRRQQPRRTSGETDVFGLGGSGVMVVWNWDRGLTKTYRMCPPQLTANLTAKPTNPGGFDGTQRTLNRQISEEK
jgi:hypothetical protein